MPTPRQKLIEHEQAQQEVNTRYHYLETTQAISQSILEAPDITHILNELLEKTMAVGGFDLGNIRRQHKWQNHRRRLSGISEPRKSASSPP
jgi:hypothetical protein